MKKDFTLLNNEAIVYLDNAATTQKPKSVLLAMNQFYERSCANINRGLYDLSVEATSKYNEARKTIASFIGANKDEIVFTKGTTESINIIAHALSNITDKREIVLTEMEHHANIVPWLELKGFSIKYIPLKGYDLDYEAAEKIITNKTALVSLTHISNVFGTIVDVDRIAKIAHSKGALIAVDGAQSLGHIPITVTNYDFYSSSAHKAFGPMGIGILYGKKKLLDAMNPLLFGGDMIKTVSFTEAEFAVSPQKFEGGTQNIAGAIGFLEAIKYIQKIGFTTIKKHDQELRTYALSKLKTIKDIKIYHSENSTGVAILSFNIKNIHPHDVASLLSDKNICVRAGHHCAMPLMKMLNVSGMVRASFTIYNTTKDVDTLTDGLRKIQEVFNG